MIYQRLGFQPSASLVQQIQLQCFEQRLTNYHYNLVSMPHLHHPVPDQRSGDQEIQPFLTSIICCQPSRCDAMSGADINISQWWWKGAHILEKMLEAMGDCFMQSSLFLSLLCLLTQALLQRRPLRERMVSRHVAVISLVLHSTWLYIIQLQPDDIFQFPQVENCL